MVAIREGALVVVAPPGDSISFTLDQIAEAEVYCEAVNFGLEMLRQQAQARDDSRQRAKRATWSRGRERGES